MPGVRRRSLRHQTARLAQLSCGKQLTSHHPDIRQCKQRVQLRRVLGQAAVADRDVAELTLDQLEGVVAAGQNLRLKSFDPVPSRQAAVSRNARR